MHPLCHDINLPFQHRFLRHYSVEFTLEQCNLLANQMFICNAMPKREDSQQLFGACIAIALQPQPGVQATEELA